MQVFKGIFLHLMLARLGKAQLNDNSSIAGTLGFVRLATTDDGAALDSAAALAAAVPTSLAEVTW